MILFRDFRPYFPVLFLCSAAFINSESATLGSVTLSPRKVG